MSNPAAGIDPAWNHQLEPVLPVELAPLQRRYVADLPVPTLTGLDLNLREGVELRGVKVEGQLVAFALIQSAPPPGLPAPLLVALAAPGQNGTERRRFFREVVVRCGIQGLWARSDDALLLEVVMLEGWAMRSMGPLLQFEQTVPVEQQEGIEVRHLLPGDLEAVLALTMVAPFATPDASTRDDLWKLLQDRMLDGLYEGGELRALAQILPQHAPQFVSVDIVVHPAFRQRGFGRILAAAVTEAELEAGRRVLAAFRSEELIGRRMVESIGGRVQALYYLATPPA